MDFHRPPYRRAPERPWGALRLVVFPMSEVIPQNFSEELLGTTYRADLCAVDEHGQMWSLWNFQRHWQFEYRRAIGWRISGFSPAIRYARDHGMLFWPTLAMAQAELVSGRGVGLLSVIAPTMALPFVGYGDKA